MASNLSAPTRLYLIQVAKIPGFEAPIVCYLIQTGDGKNILIDSGLAPGTPPSPGMPEPILGPNVVEQLASIGIKPDDINIFIATHFDPDHAGLHDLFPKAEFIVQRKHYAMAFDSFRCSIAQAHWNQPTLHYRMVDGDTTLIPGVELIETPGHVTGHQSVLVRLPETGNVLLAIDAITMQPFATPERELTPLDENLDELRASTVKLLDLAKKENAAMHIFGHDGQQWATLRKLPEFYS